MASLHAPRPGVLAVAVSALNNTCVERLEDAYFYDPADYGTTFDFNSTYMHVEINKRINCNGQSHDVTSTSASRSTATGKYSGKTSASACTAPVYIQS